MTQDLFDELEASLAVDPELHPAKQLRLAPPAPGTPVLTNRTPVANRAPPPPARRPSAVEDYGWRASWAASLTRPMVRWTRPTTWAEQSKPRSTGPSMTPSGSPRSA